MLSLERCRKVLGSGCALSDAELERLRDQLYAVADAATTAFMENRHMADTQPPHAERARAPDGSQPVAGFDTALTLVPEEGRDAMEERAAIMEYDGELDRETAELESFSANQRKVGQK